MIAGGGRGLRGKYSRLTSAALSLHRNALVNLFSLRNSQKNVFSTHVPWWPIFPGVSEENKSVKNGVFERARTCGPREECARPNRKSLRQGPARTRRGADADAEGAEPVLSSVADCARLPVPGEGGTRLGGRECGWSPGSLREVGDGLLADF